MPFCPNCKETYPKGVAVCSKCNVPLNNETSVETVPVFALQREDAAQKFIEYMSEQGIDGSYRYSMRENAFKVYVDKPDVKKAVKLFASFYVMESKRRRGEDTEKAQTDGQATDGEAKTSTEETNADASAVQEEVTKEDSTEAAPEEATTTASDETADVQEEDTTATDDAQNVEEPSVEEPAAQEDAIEETVLMDSPATDDVAEDSISEEIVEEPAEEPAPIASEIVSPTEETEPSEPVSEAPAAPSTGSRRPFRNLFIGRLRRSEENNPSTKTPEPEASVASDADKDEPIKEEVAPVEEVVEEVIEEAAPVEEIIEEAPAEEIVEEAPVEEIIEEAPVEETPEEVIEEASIEEILEEAPVEEITEEVIEEAAVSEEIVEEIIEEAPVEETPEEVIEEAPIEEILEEAPVEEITEEVIEEAPVEEIVEEAPVEEIIEEVIEEVAPAEEIVEEAPVEEAIEEVIEEAPVEEIAEEVIEVVDEAITAPFEYIPEPEETISEEISVEEAIEEPAAEELPIDSSSNVVLETSETVEDSVATDDGSVIEEIIPDASLYSGDASEYESVSLRPTDIQDTKIVVPLDYNIIEEVISTDDSIDAEDIMSPGISSFADPSKAKDNNFRRASKNVRRYTTGADDLDSQTFKAFVPDYTIPSAPEMDPEDETEKAFEEFKKRIKERKNEQNRTNAEQQKERVRLANLAVDLGKGRKLIFEDTDDLDSYAGFVPDYTPNPDEMEAFEYYKPHSVSDYSRFKKANRATAATEFVSGMRLTSPEETMRLFMENVPEGANRIINPSEVRTSNFILSMNGRQLILLFNSWMLLNISLATVKAFESEEATEEENFKRKIEGIKKRITDTFGAINESFLDNLVHKYYARYLDD